MAYITLIRPAAIATSSSYSVGLVPPLGLAYIASSLRATGHDVVVIDAVGEAPEQQGKTAYKGIDYFGLSNPEICDRIPARCDGIAVSAMFSIQWPHTADLLRGIRRRFPDKPIIVGGEHATATWRYLLDTHPEIDAVGLGEGEQVMVNWATCLQANRKFADIPGIAYRQQGRAVLPQAPRRVRTIDQLGWPAWDLFPLDNYFRAGNTFGVDRGRCLPVLATRGCPYACTFCSSPQMWTRRYICRDPADVVDEIEHYATTYGVRNVDFYDLTAIIKKSWILDFCNELEARKLSITFQLPTGTRSEVLDDEVLTALYNTGCRNLCYAPESGSPRTLKAIDKRVNLDAMLDSIATANRVGITTKCNLIIGFPHETRRDLMQTLLFGLRMARRGANDLPMFRFSPYPGSKLFQSLQDSGDIPELNDDYFVGLAYTNFRHIRSYARQISGVELILFQFIAMSLFVLASYVRRPWRIFGTVRNIIANRHQTITEQRFGEWINRLGRARKPQRPKPGANEDELLVRT